VWREDRDIAQAEARRREAEDAAKLAAARKTRPTLDDLRAKYGPNWGLKSLNRDEKSRAEIMAELGGGNYERGLFVIAGIPDAPRRVTQGDSEVYAMS
jgi:hypothetical protein